jgi:hypothetical protein
MSGLEFIGVRREPENSNVVSITSTDVWKQWSIQETQRGRASAIIVRTGTSLAGDLLALDFMFEPATLTFTWAGERGEVAAKVSNLAWFALVDVEHVVTVAGIACPLTHVDLIPVAHPLK